MCYFFLSSLFKWCHASFWLLSSPVHERLHVFLPCITSFTYALLRKNFNFHDDFHLPPQAEPLCWLVLTDLYFYSINFFNVKLVFSWCIFYFQICKMSFRATRNLQTSDTCAGNYYFYLMFFIWDLNCEGLALGLRTCLIY